MSERTLRVAENIKEEIGRMLGHGDIKDPRIGFITITDVDVTKDLRQARIFFSSLGSAKERADAREGLNSARGYIRSELGRRLRIKYIPEVDFRFDESVEAAARISKLIHGIHKSDENID